MFSLAWPLPRSRSARPDRLRHDLPQHPKRQIVQALANLLSRCRGVPPGFRWPARAARLAHRGEAGIGGNAGMATLAERRVERARAVSAEHYFYTGMAALLAAAMF